MTGRTNGTAYDYQIRATVGEPTVDGTLFGEPSDTVSATPRKPPPAKPTGLTATAGDGQVTLNWNDPNNAAIDSWSVRRRTPPDTGAWGAWLTIENSDADTVAHTVTGLANGTAYEFQILAQAGTSVGAASDAVSATPMALTPTVEFVSATSSEIEGTLMTVLVRITNPGASFVLGYAVTGTATRGTDFTVPDSLTVDAGAGAAVIFVSVSQDALREPDETVIITLADGDGYDLGSRTVHTATIANDDPPLAPAGLTAAAGDGEVTLSWTDPSDADITVYEFRRRAPAGTGTWGGWTEIARSTAATTTHTVTGLTNGTAYGFQVRAAEGRQLGAVSAEVTATPTAAAPGAPTGFTATAGPGGGQVTLRWTRPSGTVTDYQYRVRRPGGGWFGWATMSGGAGITSFTGSFTEVLDFQMRARNGSVGGTPSAIARATPVAAPAAPAGLTATAGNARVALGWTNPNNGDITKWQFRQRTGGGGFGSWTDIPNSDADTTAHTVTGLTNGTAYGFQVRAAAAPGGTVPGAASAAVSATPALPGVGLVLDPTSLKVAEGGSATYTVALATKPTGSVTVTVAGAGGEVTADADAVQGGDQSTLTFTTVNWATPRTVTVSAGHDLDGVNDSATLTHTAAGGGYGSATGSVAVTVVDDDAAFLVGNDPDGTATGGVNDEFATAFTTGGNAAGYAVSSVSVRLFARSGRPLSVAIREDGAGGRPGALAARLSNPPSPADDAANVFAAPDGTVLKAGATYWLVANDGRRTDTNAQNAFFAVTNSDAYGGAAGWSIAPASRRTEESQTTPFAEASPVVLMFGIEAEAVTAALAFSRDAVTVVEEADAAYTVALAGRPTGSVTVTIASDNGDVTVDTDATAPGSQNTLTFTTSDWSAPKTVTVSAADDNDAANDAATLTHTAAGGNYASVTGSVAVTVTDNDAPGLVLDPTALTVAEGGSGAYTVKLATQPTGSVTVTVAGASGEVTFDTDSTANGNQSTLTFNTTNWGTARTVTVSAGQDNDGVDDGATLTHSASGGGYGSVTGSVAVTVADDDAAPAAPAGLAAAGGHRQVVLSWTDPGDGAIDGWQFRQRTPPVTGAWGSWTNIADSTATTAAHTVTGLTNGTAYGFQVRAVDGALEGAASSEAAATPAAVTFGLTPLEASVRVPLPEGTTVRAFNWFLNRRLNDADPATVGFPITLGGSAARGSDYTLSCRSPASDQMDSACSGMDSGTPTITLDRARLGSRSRGSVYLMVNVAADGAVEAEETLTMATSGTSLTFRIVEAPASVTVGFTRERFTHSRVQRPDHVRPAVRRPDRTGPAVPAQLFGHGDAGNGLRGPRRLLGLQGQRQRHPGDHLHLQG